MTQEYTQEELDAMSIMDTVELLQEDSDDPEIVEHSRNSFLALINSHIEKYRNSFTSRGAIQSMVYQEKVDQATDFIASGYANESDYPLLVAEATAAKKTTKKVADTIILKRSEWLQKITQTEEMRIVARNKIKRDRKITSFAKTTRALRLTLEEMRK